MKKVDLALPSPMKTIPGPLVINEVNDSEPNIVPPAIRKNWIEESTHHET